VGARRRRALKLFDESQFSDCGTAEVGFAHGSVAVVPGAFVNRQRPLVLLVGVQVCLLAVGRAQRVVGGDEQRAPDAPARVSGVDEQQEQLAVGRVCGRVADDWPAWPVATSSTFGGAWLATSWSQSSGVNIGIWASSPR
jgi:hypothetical protein